MMRTGREGYACASAKRETAGNAAAPAARCRNCLRWGSFILNLPSHHSITSSARTSSVGGIVRPSALAVIRLMTRSNLVGCSTGRSAGLLALENPGDIEPSAAIAIRDIIAVAHQPTLFDIFSDAIHGRNRVTRRQRDYLLASARKERT